MQVHRFVKEDNQWFIDLPEYLANGGSKGDLQMVAGADTMLDIMSNGNNHVIIAMDEEAFEDADKLQLQEICDPTLGGGIYQMEWYEGKKIMQQMWLCAVTEFVFGYLPPAIFVKRVHKAGKPVTT